MKNVLELLAIVLLAVAAASAEEVITQEYKGQRAIMASEKADDGVCHALYYEGASEVFLWRYDFRKDSTHYSMTEVTYSRNLLNGAVIAGGMQIVRLHVHAVKYDMVIVSADFVIEKGAGEIDKMVAKFTDLIKEKKAATSEVYWLVGEGKTIEKKTFVDERLNRK